MKTRSEFFGACIHHAPLVIISNVSPASSKAVPQEPAQQCQHRPVSYRWTRWRDVGLPVSSRRYPVTTVLRVEMERIHHRRNHDSKPCPTKSRDLLHLKLKLQESDRSTNTKGARSGSRVPHCERRSGGCSRRPPETWRIRKRYNVWVLDSSNRCQI